MENPKIMANVIQQQATAGPQDQPNLGEYMRHSPAKFTRKDTPNKVDSWI